MHQLNFDPQSALGAQVVRLFNRIKTEIENRDGSWDGGDVVNELGPWLGDLGIDITGDAIVPDAAAAGVTPRTLLPDTVGVVATPRALALAVASSIAGAEVASRRTVRHAGGVPALPATLEHLNRDDLHARGWNDYLITKRLGEPDRRDILHRGTTARPVGTWKRDRVLAAEHDLRGEKPVTADNAEGLFGTRVRIEATGLTGVLRHLKHDTGNGRTLAGVDLDTLLPVGMTTQWTDLGHGVAVLTDQTPVRTDAHAQLTRELRRLKTERARAQRTARALEARSRALNETAEQAKDTVALHLPQAFVELAQGLPVMQLPEPEMTDSRLLKVRLAWEGARAADVGPDRNDGLLLVAVLDVMWWFDRLALQALVGRLGPLTVHQLNACRQVRDHVEQIS
ncbi:hypothetical protein [Kitasatospora sp. NPDC058046]|uniref:hypothetical protein n=1 Tax=Kitasatospora sp. NPDC058046 TaxID=3346312 RepID=UPI0036DAA55A